MLHFIILQATAPQNPWISQVLMFGGIGIVFYFFMLRPQQKKAKEQKLFKEALKKGDKVVTIGGVHGTIVSVEDETITLDVDRGVKIVYEKAAISPESSKKLVNTAS